MKENSNFIVEKLRNANLDISRRFVRQLVGDLAGEIEGLSLVLAVSGGLDSVVLLHLSQSCLTDYGIKLHVATVDHGLRDRSLEDAQFVEDLCASYGLPCWRRRLVPPGSGNIEAWGRSSRYEFFEEVRQETSSEWIFGDNIIPGPWQKRGQTNPAVARLFDNHWYFYIYRFDQTVNIQVWGGNGDIPKVADYDGDGIFDISVFRPSESKTYVIQSTTGLAAIYEFGSGTADHTVRGDYTNDGIDDIAFWEPISGLFFVLKSDLGFSPALALSKDPNYYQELKLGTFIEDLPLSFNKRAGLQVFTTINHQTGVRSWRPSNDPKKQKKSIQWGLPGDAQG